MTDGTDWFAWHADYRDESSPLSRRLRIVQRHIAGWLDERGDNGVTVVSACAGQGHDLIDVLDQRADAGRVHATLIESDPRNVRAARAAATAARLANVEVPPSRCAETSPPTVAPLPQTWCSWPGCSATSATCTSSAPSQHSPTSADLEPR